MIPLSEVQSAAVRAIIDGTAHGRKDAHGKVPHYACSPVKALEKAGFPAEVQAELLEGGWLTTWDRKDGTFLTLSPEAAEAAHVELDEHLEFAAADHPTRTRRPLGRIARGADGKIARDFDGRVLRSGPGGTIPREPATAKAVPERCQRAEPEPYWRPAPPAVDPITGRAVKPPREPVRLPQRHRESYLGECDGLQPVSRELDPADAAILAEELALAEEEAARGGLAGGLGAAGPAPGVRFVMEEKRTEDGRLEVDETTGKVKLKPVRILGEMAQFDARTKATRARKRAGRKAKRASARG